MEHLRDAAMRSQAIDSTCTRLPDDPALPCEESLEQVTERMIAAAQKMQQAFSEAHPGLRELGKSLRETLAELDQPELPKPKGVSKKLNLPHYRLIGNNCYKGKPRRK
jgi:hypothetical protein